MIKKILLSLFLSFSAASAQGAASEDDILPCLWEAAEQTIPAYEPKEAYITLLFTRMVWLHTFGQRCTSCTIPNCASNKFFDQTASSILLNRTTLADTLTACKAIPCLQQSAGYLDTAAKIIGDCRIDFHKAGAAFDVCTVTANAVLKPKITTDEHEACVYHVQISILSP
jgi:hypothetical protein